MTLFRRRRPLPPILRELFARKPDTTTAEAELAEALLHVIRDTPGEGKTSELDDQDCDDHEN